MSNVAVTAGVKAKEAEIRAVVIRCGCDDPDSHSLLQRPCPSPRNIEDKGRIAYYHRNPLRRWAWAMFQEGRR